MDRRSFIMTLIGGMAAAGIGGVAAVEAATPRPVPMPTPEPAEGDDQLATDTKDALDKTDADFSQYYYYRRRPRYVVRRRYYRPRYYSRPRYYRPRRRVYFY